MGVTAGRCSRRREAPMNTLAQKTLPGLGGAGAPGETGRKVSFTQSLPHATGASHCTASFLPAKGTLQRGPGHSRRSRVPLKPKRPEVGALELLLSLLDCPGFHTFCWLTCSLLEAFANSFWVASGVLRKTCPTDPVPLWQLEGTRDSYHRHSKGGYGTLA